MVLVHGDVVDAHLEAGCCCGGDDAAKPVHTKTNVRGRKMLEHRSAKSLMSGLSSSRTGVESPYCPVIDVHVSPSTVVCTRSQPLTGTLTIAFTVLFCIEL